MKVLDVELFREGIRRHAEMLSRQRTEIEAIFHSVYGLVSLEDVLKGQGGDAIRTFYAECHLPFLQFFMTFEERFTEVLTSMDDALSSLEPDTSGFIRESFLEGEVEQGLTQIAQLTESLTDETNSIMQQVSDIVALPQLDDSEVQAGVRNAKIKKEDTITSLHEFDVQQTNALTPIEQDLETMETWLSDMEGLFASGLTDVNFPVEQWAITSSQNTLWTDLVQRTMPLGPLPIPENTPFSYVLPIDSPNVCDVPAAKQGDVGIDIAKGIGAGLYDAGKDFVTGIWDLIVNPVESVEGIFYSVIHPVETFTYLKTAITDSYERDVTNGDAYSRSRWFSYAVGTIGASIVGTKGAGALMQTGASGTRILVQNTTLRSQRLPNLFPNGSRMGLAKFEKIPFNVLNGPEIRSQLFSTFKTTSKNSNTIKNASVVMKDKLEVVQAQFANGSGAVGRVVDETITNVNKASAKGPEFSFASSVVKPVQSPSSTIQSQGKGIVSRIESVGIGGRGKGKENPPKITEIQEEDLGKHIIKGKNGRKELAPNVRYITEDGYKYTTDELGRIVDVDAGELILQKGKRNKGMQIVAGREDRLPNDDGGHLIGTQFHGSGDIDNLLAQNRQINRSGGEWYKMETEWANALKETPPKKVSVKIKPVFIGTSLRPDSYKVVYEIEGKGIFKKTIENRGG